MNIEIANFVNLACDFKQYWQTEKNPLLWSDEERKEFIKTVSEKEPKLFKRYGYFIINDLLYWTYKKLN